MENLRFHDGKLRIREGDLVVLGRSGLRFREDDLDVPALSVVNLYQRRWIKSREPGDIQWIYKLELAVVGNGR